MRARACALPPDDAHMQGLEARLRLGTAWEDRIKGVLEKPSIGSTRIPSIVFCIYQLMFAAITYVPTF